jgi:hypothetical protein
MVQYIGKIFDIVREENISLVRKFEILCLFEEWNFKGILLFFHIYIVQNVCKWECGPCKKIMAQIGEEMDKILLVVNFII